MPVDQEHHDRRWWTLGAVCVATFMLLLDITIVNVALPDIEKSLHSSFTDLQWVIDAYALSLAALLLTAGSLADLFGRRLIFVGGLAVFTTASLLCGLSTTPTFLDVARALQGIGAAALLVAFVVVERRQARPMFDLTLFRKRAFAGVSIAAFCLSASMFSMFLYLTLYIQNSLGYSPLQAGLRFLPVSLLSFVVAPIAGKLSATVPVRIMIGAGLGLVGIGLVLMAHVDAGSSWTVLLPGFLFAGVGVGLINP